METEKRGIFMLIESSVSPPFRPFCPLSSSPSLAAMSIHLADGPKSLTCGGNNYHVNELNLGCGDRGSGF